MAAASPPTLVARPLLRYVLDDPAATLRWEVDVDGEGWVRYPPLQQLAIESAFADSAVDSVDVRVGRWEYTIRFDRGESLLLFAPWL
jgi:hypothetical protein